MNRREFSKQMLVLGTGLQAGLGSGDAKAAADKQEPSPRLGGGADDGINFRVVVAFCTIGGGSGEL